MNIENTMDDTSSSIEQTITADDRPTIRTLAGRPRGFAAVNPETLREIARKGGKAAHAAGTAHRFNREEARAAGAKGGKAAHAAKRAAKAQS